MVSRGLHWEGGSLPSWSNGSETFLVFCQCSTSQLSLLILHHLQCSSFKEKDFWSLRNAASWYFSPWSTNQVLVSHCCCQVVERDLLLWRTMNWKDSFSSHVFKIKIRKNCYLSIFWVVYFAKATFLPVQETKELQRHLKFSQVSVWEHENKIIALFLVC